MGESKAFGIGVFLGAVLGALILITAVAYLTDWPMLILRGSND